MPRFVTGAATGIGESVARRFAAEGATLVLDDRNADKLRNVTDSHRRGTRRRARRYRRRGRLPRHRGRRFITGVDLPVDGGLTASNGQPPLS